MLAKLSWATIFFMLLYSSAADAQTVGKKVCKLLVTRINLLNSDATLEFVADVRIADCISHITVIAKETKSIHNFGMSVENFYMKDDSILFNISVGSVKKYLKRKKKVNIELIVYSLSGETILKKTGLLEKELLGRLDSIELK